MQPLGNRAPPKNDWQVLADKASAKYPDLARSSIGSAIVKYQNDAYELKQKKREASVKFWNNGAGNYLGWTLAISIGAVTSTVEAVLGGKKT